MKVYELEQDVENYSSLYEKSEELENVFKIKYSPWKEVDLETYKPMKINNHRSYHGIKNVKMDIGVILGSFMILSEKSWHVLKDILSDKGQLLPIEIESKRKKFIGFYPNKNQYDISIINLERSDWKQGKNGKIFSTVVLKSNYPKEEYLFTIHEDISRIYITEKFKKLVEKHDLKGFDFSKEIEVSD